MRRFFLIPFLIASFLAQSQTPAKSTVWQMQESGTTAGLRGIHSVDGAIAWASGTGGTVLKTVDGGAHWQKCAIPDGEKDGATLDFRGVQAWDAQTAIVMASGPGEKSRLYKTTDGCRTWRLLFKNPDAPDGFFDSFYFPKTQSLHRDHEGFGLLIGDPVGGQFAVFETHDGGDSWARLWDQSLTASASESGAFAASNSCIAGNGEAAFDFVVGGRAGSSLIRLNYQGQWRSGNPLGLKREWSKQALPLARGGDGAGPFSVGERACIHPECTAPRIREMAVGGDYTKPDESSGTSAWSADSGAHWTGSTTPPHGYRSSVQWSEALKAWITVGTNGSDISRDDGKTWQPLDGGNWNALSLPFVVGPNGRIARITDAAAILPHP